MSKAIRFGAMALVMSAYGMAHGITLGQVDTFEDETEMGWFAGIFNHPPVPPTTITSGGPGGDGDAFLQITSSEPDGPGSRLVAQNITQWAGDYLAAGVNEINLDLKNFGNTDLNIRLGLFVIGDGGPTDAIVTDDIFLAAGGDWTNHTFSLREADVSVLVGSYGNAMGNAFELRILNNANPGNAALELGQLGVDNMQAVPEPATMAALGLGLAGIMARRRRK